MSLLAKEHTTGRSLISTELFNRLVSRIITDDKLDRRLAERIIDQALAFLSACAANSGTPLAPSESVDIGWHAFLLHTRDYAEFCDRIAGRFLHHVPTEPGSPASGPAARHRAVAAIGAAGFVVDTDLWPESTASCTGCHNGCHDDPPPATEPY